MARGMDQAKPFASLSPSLLARKGGAKPAMRQQLAQLSAALGCDFESDLGWNDMGEDAVGDDYPESPAQVVPIHRNTPVTQVRARTSALKKGRKAAFTLRLDAERHLKLRLACTLDACSAQALVTDALDRLLAEMPEIDVLADQVGKRRKS